MVNLCDAPSGRGGTWTDDDAIIFTPSIRRQRHAHARLGGRRDTGGTFGTLGKGAVHAAVAAGAPGGKGVLYTEHSSANSCDAANLVVAPLAGGAPTIVVRGGYYGRCVPGGPSSRGAKAGTWSTCSKARSSPCASISIGSRRSASRCLRSRVSARIQPSPAVRSWPSPPEGTFSVRARHCRDDGEPD